MAQTNEYLFMGREKMVNGYIIWIIIDWAEAL